ncbi:hypothetical protein [Streptomyces sp. NPDC001388]|uniref:hypothetical protein n=1 Tax=Streptomyces sp. NPDC001388 TaxID=3364568 RepID=UPI003678F1FA
MSGVLLYARSRAVPGALAALAGTAVLAGLAVGAARTGAGADPDRLAAAVALAPLPAVSVLGMSLYAASDELDRTAVRPWWPRRLAHLLGLTAVAAALLPLVVVGDGLGFGPSAMLRNVLGCTGVTAAAAGVLGARMSWLPGCAYVGAVCLASAGVHGRAVAVWAWPVQPGQVTAAWVAAAVAFLLGTALYAVRGARPEGPRG